MRDTEEFLEVCSEDAVRMGLNDGQWVKVESRRGSVKTRIKISKKVSPGLVFMSFHFPDSTNTNVLTINATDPLAGTAEFKACAVRITAIQNE